MSARPAWPVCGRQLAAALAGREPAEALPPRERRQLVRQLVADGMTDVELAAHTGWSTYTVARLRRGLGLAPNYARSPQ